MKRYIRELANDMIKNGHDSEKVKGEVEEA